MVRKPVVDFIFAITGVGGRGKSTKIRYREVVRNVGFSCPAFPSTEDVDGACPY